MTLFKGTFGSVVLEALYYKPEGSGSRPDEVNEFFQCTYSFRQALDPGVYSV
jgi:hypothetical protein